MIEAGQGQVGQDRLWVGGTWNAGKARRTIDLCLIMVKLMDLK